VGAPAVRELVRRGNQVRVLSRRAPAPSEAEYQRVDLVSGVGLPEALEGVDVVIDASNVFRPGRMMEQVLVRATSRLLAAEKTVGVHWHVLISIVGIDELRLSYYAAKRMQEQLVLEASLKASVLRATQFHQLLARVFAAGARFALLPGGRILLQPVDAEEVAVTLVDAVEQGAWSGRREIVGPEVLPLRRLARSWLAATGRRALLVPLPIFGATGHALRAGALTSGQAPHGTLTFSRWLHENRPHAEAVGL
jgi:uncharacterized protein YbjT (DUF2867 family)